MVEIGVAGPPFRASAIAVGAALGAETDGAHAVWFADVPAGAIPADVWREHAGPLGSVFPDPDDLADPVVTAAAAALVTRAIRIGVLGRRPSADASREARTLATLADLAPGRVTVALAGDEPALAPVAAALAPDVDVELCVYGDAAVAAALGWGWLAAGADVAGFAAGRPHTGIAGVHLPVVAAGSSADAEAAAAGPVLRALLGDPGAAGVVVGDAVTVGRVVDEHVAAGATRIVLENVTPFGDPARFESSQAVVREVIRTARLRHRSAA